MYIYNKSKSEINFLFFLLLSLRSNKHFEPAFSSPELLNAQELQRHVLQARYRHGSEQYLAICSRVQKIDLRQQFCTAGAYMQRHCAYACKQCANALFYSPPLNAKEFIQILLRASYPHAPEHYSTKNFVVRPAARSKITPESDRTNASNAATRFFQRHIFKRAHWRAPVRMQVLRQWFFQRHIFKRAHWRSSVRMQVLLHALYVKHTELPHRQFWAQKQK